MPVTQKQIAAHLGLSQSMVAEALGGHPRISEDTRQRVAEAAAQMGYIHGQSNGAARAMAAQRHGRRALTGNIGCLGLDPNARSNSYELHLQQGIRRASEAAGREVLLLPSQPSPGWEKVDGIIGHGEFSLPARNGMVVEIPQVSLMVVPPEGMAVVADDYSGSQQATEHLLALGHRRIGMLTDPRSAPVAERIRGYREALSSVGIEPDAQWQRLLSNKGPMEERGQKSMRKWLEQRFRETGISALLVQNDRAAIGAMQVLQAAGLKVPQDVSIVGFDSTDECELSSPRLTSVRVPLEEMGARAVEMLLQRIDGDEALAETVTFPVQLQVRESTAPPAPGRSQ